MRYFILGASGFIGSEVVEALLQSGHQVTALQHRSKLKITHPNLTTLSGSLKSAVSFLKRERPDVIIHLARISGGRYALGRYIQSLRAKKYNQAIRNYVQETTQVRFYYVSGSLMYGNSTNVILENKPLSPISFARQYQLAEKPFVVDPPKNCTVFRPGWVFGNASWYSQFFLKPMAQTNKVPQYGKGENWMTLIHVRDLARLIVTYTEKAPAQSVYNLYSGITVTLAEFTQTLALIHQKEILILTEAEVSRRYNQTVAEAFASTILLRSNYTTLIDAFDFEFKQLKDLFLSKIE